MDTCPVNRQIEYRTMSKLSTFHSSSSSLMMDRRRRGRCSRRRTCSSQLFPARGLDWRFLSTRILLNPVLSVTCNQGPQRSNNILFLSTSSCHSQEPQPSCHDLFLITSVCNNPDRLHNCNNSLNHLPTSPPPHLPSDPCSTRPATLRE